MRSSASGVFLHETHLPHPPEVVFAWHERPGALARLTPALMGRTGSEPSDGIRDGSVASFAVSLPGMSSLPWVGERLLWPWRARHLGYDPPHSFEDVMESGPFAAWHHRHAFEPDGQGGTMLTDEVTYAVPGPSVVSSRVRSVVEEQLHRIFAYRSAQLAADLDFHATHSVRRTVAVTGAHGLVGRQLVALLGGGGHEVRRLVRGAPTGNDLRWDPAAGVLDTEDLRDVDVVIHLAGEPIGRRFTPEHKQEVLRSRTASTALLASVLGTLAADGRPRALVVASAAGWYGADRGDEVLTEDSAPGDDFLAAVCRAWESAADAARDAGLRVVHLRTGYVQAAGGGQLALQLPLYRLGLGGRLGDGRQWMPWITLDDLVALYAHVALTDTLSGVVNACAPNPVRAGDYARTLGAVLARPAVLPVPSFGPALLLGRQGARELALAGQRMSADRALSWGHRFRHPQLRGGLEHVLAVRPG